MPRSTPSMPSTGSPSRRWVAGFGLVMCGARQGLDALTDFLRQAGVPLPEIERAWQTLARRRIHSIPRIALTPAHLEALGL